MLSSAHDRLPFVLDCINQERFFASSDDVSRLVSVKRDEHVKSKVGHVGADGNQSSESYAESLCRTRVQQAGGKIIKRRDASQKMRMCRGGSTVPSMPDFTNAASLAEANIQLLENIAGDINIQ